MPVSEAMSRTLLPRVKAILKFEDAARSFDVDGIHDMRVATKRLREAARLFRPAVGKKLLRHNMAHLELLNDTLGVARELDVQMLGIQELIDQEPVLEAGLEPVLVELRINSEEAGVKLIPVMDATIPCIKEDFKELVTHCSPGREKVWNEPFSLLATTAITKRLEVAFKLEPAARVPGAVADFHKMRIGIKKVKYALEVFLPILRKPVKKAYKPLSDLQEIMGIVHDWDVLISVLEEHSGKDIEPALINTAIREAWNRRETGFAHTLALLDEIKQNRLCQKLLKNLA